MSESINPYITDNPVGTHTTFIERTHILREIMLVLRHAKKMLSYYTGNGA